MANGHSRLGLPNDLIDSNSHTLDQFGLPGPGRRWVERGLLGLLGCSEINSYPTIFCNFEVLYDPKWANLAWNQSAQNCFPIEFCPGGGCLQPTLLRFY